MNVPNSLLPSSLSMWVSHRGIHSQFSSRAKHNAWEWQLSLLREVYSNLWKRKSCTTVTATESLRSLTNRFYSWNLEYHGIPTMHGSITDLSDPSLPIGPSSFSSSGLKGPRLQCPENGNKWLGLSWTSRWRQSKTLCARCEICSSIPLHMADGC